MKKIIFALSCMFVITILAGFVSAQAWPNNLNDGLVYYFKLDETSGNTIEHVANRVSGVVEGATQGIPGIIVNSYSFDGIDDRVNFGDVTEVEGINELTISAWVKTTSGGQQAIIQNGYGSQDSFWIYLFEGRPIFNVQVAPCYTQVSSVSILDGDWHLITGVFNGHLPTPDINLYIDGVLTAPAANRCVGSVSQVSGSLSFGASSNPAGGAFFNGSIDEVAFWNRSLEESEILRLYNNGMGITYGTPCTDNDGDGFFADCEPLDCDDNNPEIHPNATEICDGGIDNNCDGLIEEYFLCREFECSDRIDNDLDGFIDKADQDCSQLQCVLPTFQKAEPEP